MNVSSNRLNVQFQKDCPDEWARIQVLQCTIKKLKAVVLITYKCRYSFDLSTLKTNVMSIMLIGEAYRSVLCI
jgi:hypothetical protein